jgi:hypothetical protein
MKIQNLADGSLIIQETWPLLRTACLMGGILLPVIMVFAELVGASMRYDRIAGAVLGSALMLLIGAVVPDRKFIFDAPRKRLTWEFRNWFRTRGGQLPFSDIKDVLVTSERSRSDDNAYLIT